MKRGITELAATACIDLISLVASEAGALAKAAQHCAETRNARSAVLNALDLEPLLDEANSFLQAAAVIRRRIDPP